MESFFRARPHFGLERRSSALEPGALPDRRRAICHRRLPAVGNRAYRVRVLMEAERPLGARTVVVQLLKTARMRTAPRVERRMVRIGFFLVGLLWIRK